MKKIARKMITTSSLWFISIAMLVFAISPNILAQENQAAPGNSDNKKIETKAEGAQEAKSDVPAGSEKKENALHEEKLQQAEPTGNEVTTPEKEPVADDKDAAQAQNGQAQKKDASQNQAGGAAAPAPEQKQEIARTQAVPQEKKPLLAMQLAYGGFFPVGPYNSHYDPGHLVTCGTGLYRYNAWGIAPEFIFRYGHLDSIESSRHSESTFDLFQLSLGLVYRYEFGLPASWQKYAFFRRSMCFFARINDGVSVVHFKREGESPVEEGINTLGLSAGLTYPVWRELSLGFELGYQVIFTAGDYLQGMTLSLLAEYRL